MAAARVSATIGGVAITPIKWYLFMVIGMYLIASCEGAVKAKICTAHPNVDELLKRGAASYTLPSGHPQVNAMLRLAGMDRDHDNVDQLLAQGKKFPSDHISVEAYLNRTIAACPPPINGCIVNISLLHANVTKAVLNIKTTRPPIGHPLIHSYYAPYLPVTHKNIDTLLSSGTALPSGHPPIGPGVCRDPTITGSLVAGTCLAYVTKYHPFVDTSLAAGRTVPTGHPLVHSYFASMLPSTHPNIDSLLAAGTPLPQGHLSLDPYLCRTNTSSLGWLCLTYTRCVVLLSVTNNCLLPHLVWCFFGGGG
jgi:hypothetical protein